MWRGLVLVAALISLPCWLAGPVQAASVSGRASTVLEVYDNADEDTALPVYQYLQLNVRDLAPGYHFKMFGRLGDDLNDEDSDAKSELYYAYLEKKNLLQGLDFRLGRQFIATTASAATAFCSISSDRCNRSYPGVAFVVAESQGDVRVLLGLS